MRGPQDDKGTCGFDVRPLLPVLLVGSTIAGAAAGCALWFPVLREALGRPWSTIIRCFFIVLYTVTCCCMAYCGFCDPGQVPEEHPSVAYYARKEAVRKNPELYADEDEDDEDMNPIPMRAHKAWQYTRPVRRYDHYCRWLANCIGLLNHREFVVMCSGLVILGALGALLDFTVLMSLVHQGEATIGTQVGLVLHLIYSLIMGTRVWPILSLHIGFISRNELANEWKRNDFYVITSARTGKVVPVNDLSDDEHNERFDSFHYAAEKNIFDKGVSANWWSFWCTARWAPDQTGEF
uniref:Palmitoyltransferase n=1 Tax=Strombidinopsis acuminata TaxID=141414 RepID=A0A7S3TMV8_9SPIT